MARKVTNITHSASQYDILSQTPENYNPDNYFLNQLQEKINQDWVYRPNRALIEYESQWGYDKWEPIEVVIQTVKSESGTDISDDYKNIVFKNVREDRFVIGHKFRFSPKFDIKAADRKKNVWLAINDNTAKMTSGLVISRCNGILGSTYKDKQGLTHYHYEPVIQGKDLSSTGLAYNEAAVAPQSRLAITAQYNDYTRRYKINQRFIIGARTEDPENEGHFIGGSVYRITAINKYYGNSTFDPEDVGLLKLYLELTETYAYDDWDNMIAYQQDSVGHIDAGDEKPFPSQESSYAIKFATPAEIPSSLGAEEVLFTPLLISEDGTEYEDYSKYFVASISLENWPQGLSEDKQSEYVQLTSQGGETEPYTFSLLKKKPYMYGDLIVSCLLPAASSPTGEDVKASFNLVVRRRS